MHNPVSEIIKDFLNQSQNNIKEKNKQTTDQTSQTGYIGKNTGRALFLESLLVDLENREFKVSVL